MNDADDLGDYLPPLWADWGAGLERLPDMTPTSLELCRLAWHTGIWQAFACLGASMDEGGISDCPMRRMVREVADEAAAVIETLSAIDTAREARQ